MDGADSRPMRIGVDLGGSKVEAALMDPDGRIVRRERRPSPVGNYDRTLDVIADLVTGFERDLERTCPVGIAIPGTLSPATGRIKNANSTWLNGKAFDQDVARRLGRPIRLANDANCFALSEAVDGAGRGAPIVFGVILGTGVGGGLVIGGQVVNGPNAITGEWGHNPLPWSSEREVPGPPCYCGKMGCLETWISGPGWAADHKRSTGQVLAPIDIAVLANEGEPEALASFNRFMDRLARGLATVINVIDPHVIVLGGGLSNIDAIYQDLAGRLLKYVFSDKLQIAIRRNAHGDSSGIRGAAWLWAPEEHAPAA